MRELVAAGAKLDLSSLSSRAALHLASFDGYVRIAELLLDGKFEGCGVGVNVENSIGYTPLILATIYNHEAVVRLLLERGADVTLRTKTGETALTLARNKPAIRALLEAHGARE